MKIAVVAHQDRAAMAEQLMDEVGASFISWDDGTAGAEANHRAAWRWHEENTSGWAVTLEDDAIPVDGFLTQLSAALSVAPTSVVSLYLGKERPPHWQDKIEAALTEATAINANWVISTHLLHAVGVAIRTPEIPSMLGWITQVGLPIDEAISHWARKNHKAVCYTTPSLVNHKDEGTLVRHRDSMPREPGRVAWRTGARAQWDNTKVVM
jgi:hypothetical protein